MFVLSSLATALTGLSQAATGVPAQPPSTRPATLDPAPPAAQAPAIEIALPVLYDQRFAGSLSIRVEGERVSFDAAAFLALLRPELTSAALDALAARAVDGRLTPETATTDLVQVRFNMQLQQLEIETVNSARERRIITGGSREAEFNLPLEAVSGFTLAVTPTVNYEYIWEDENNLDEGSQPVRGNFDVAGRIGGLKGIAFISRQSYASGGEGPKLTRDESQLIYDDVSKLLRVTAGDLRPRGASFQAIPAIGGISVERFFGLEPTRIFRPVGQTSFEIDRPSAVEVRINGIVQREIFLRPGRYDLRDLPLVQGSNLVELVIRDETGRERVISQQNFFDFDLLEPGITDFSISAGVRAPFNIRAPKYSDDPVATAFFRHGFSETVTAGADLQGDKDGANGGASVLWASPIGVWRLEAAASQRSTYGFGYAMNAGYSATGRFGNGWRWNAQVNGQYLSRDFATVEDQPIVGPRGPAQTVATSINGSFLVNGGGWSISGAGNYTKGRGARRDSYNALLGANYTIRPDLTIGVFGRYADTGLDRDRGVLVQLIWRPTRRSDVIARYDTAQDEAELTYRRSAPRTVGATSYSVSAIRNGDNDSFNLSGDVSHIGNRFEGNARHDVFTDSDLGGNRTQRSRATVSSSLVFAGGKLALARPVGESFAIVSPHKTLKGRTIRIDPTERGYSATTDFLGAPVEPDLQAYIRQPIVVDVLDLPPGYDLGSGQFNVKPPLFGGYSLTLGSGASFTVLGRVLDAAGAPVANMGGRLVSLDKPDSPPIPAFTNRNGRLAATGVPAGRYLLTLFTTPEFTREITIGEDGPNLVDIGELKVSAP